MSCNHIGQRCWLAYRRRDDGERLNLLRCRKCGWTGESTDEADYAPAPPR